MLYVNRCIGLYKHIQECSEKLSVSLQMEQGKKPLFEPLVPVLMVLSINVILMCDTWGLQGHLQGILYLILILLSW